MLEALYIPSTLAVIGNNAFEHCRQLRIVNIQDSVYYIHPNIIEGCDGLLNDEMKNATFDQKVYWIRNRYNPLHNLCYDQSVTADDIHQYIQQHHDGDERAPTKDKPQTTNHNLLHFISLLLIHL